MDRCCFRFYYKLEYDQSIVDQALKEIDDKMVVYDKILSKQRYLAGDVRFPISSSVCSKWLTIPLLQTLTLADLFHVSFGTTMIRCGWQSYQKHPNVARYVPSSSENVRAVTM